MAETFRWCPLLGANRLRRPRIVEAAYGDGYAHRASVGINVLQDQWEVTFAGDEITLAEIDDFLGDNGIPGFWFRALPTAPLILVVCDEWRLSFSDRNGGLALGSLSATFRRQYNHQPA